MTNAPHLWPTESYYWLMDVKMKICKINTYRYNLFIECQMSFACEMVKSVTKLHQQQFAGRDTMRTLEIDYTMCQCAPVMWCAVHQNELHCFIRANETEIVSKLHNFPNCCCYCSPLLLPILFSLLDSNTCVVSKERSVGMTSANNVLTLLRAIVRI